MIARLCTALWSGVPDGVLMIHAIQSLVTALLNAGSRDVAGEDCCAPPPPALASPDSQQMDCVPLVCFTRAYLKDPSNAVGTAASDMFALGVSIRELVDVSRVHCSLMLHTAADPTLTRRCCRHFGGRLCRADCAAEVRHRRWCWRACGSPAGMVCRRSPARRRDAGGSVHVAAVVRQRGSRSRVTALAVACDRSLHVV